MLAKGQGGCQLAVLLCTVTHKRENSMTVSFLPHLQLLKHAGSLLAGTYSNFQLILSYQVGCLGVTKSSEYRERQDHCTSKEILEDFLKEVATEAFAVKS